MVIFMKETQVILSLLLSPSSYQMIHFPHFYRLRNYLILILIYTSRVMDLSSAFSVSLNFCGQICKDLILQDQFWILSIGNLNVAKHVGEERRGEESHRDNIIHVKCPPPFTYVSLNNTWLCWNGHVIHKPYFVPYSRTSHCYSFEP